VPLHAKTFPVVKNTIFPKKLMMKNYETYLREYFDDQEITINEITLSTNELLDKENKSNSVFRCEIHFSQNTLETPEIVANKAKLKNKDGRLFLSVDTIIDGTKTILWLLNAKIEALSMKFQADINQLPIVDKKNKNEKPISSLD